MRIDSRRIVCGAAALLALVRSAGEAQGVSAPSPLRNAVGFRVVRATENARPLSVWYPAQGLPGRGTMVTNDYLVAEISPGQLAEAKATFLIGVARNYGGAQGLPSGPRVPDLPDSVANAFLAMKTGATLNAPELPGRHPLVVFTIPLGNTGAANQFLLAEVIAAQGFVVASGPPMASAPPNTSFDDFMALLRVSVDSTLQGALHLPDVDTTRVAAFDPTGVTALALHAERPRLSAMIAFDEMPAPDRVRAVLASAAPSLRGSILYFPLSDPAPNGAVFGRLGAAKVTTVRIPGASHGFIEPTGTHFRRQLGGDTKMYDLAITRILDFLREELRP